MFLKNHKISKHLKVSLPDGKQEIVVGKGLSSWVIEKLASSDYSGFVIFCDHNIANIYQDFLAEIKNKLKPAEIDAVGNIFTSFIFAIPDDLSGRWKEGPRFYNLSFNIENGDKIC